MKKIVAILTALLIVFTTGIVNVRADENEVIYDGNDVKSSGGSLSDVISGLQPGGEATFTVKFTNKTDKKTDWYIANKIIKSLEDDSPAVNGGYTYILSYISPDGNTTEIFNNDTVGGDHVDGELEGLHQATDSTEEFFYLDTFDGEKSGYVEVKIILDGESQPNSYKGTVADLQVLFAVEVEESILVPETGDRSNVWLYAGLFGLSFLVVAGDIIYLFFLRKRGAQR